MLGPYRDPVLVDTDPLPDSCVPPTGGASCCPHVPPARATAARALPPAFAKAFSAAATLLLLSGSASLAAVTWTVTTTILAAHATGAESREIAPVVQIRIPPVEPPAHPRRPPAILPSWPRSLQLSPPGAETHDVEALWTRAQLLAAEHGRFSASRQTLARGGFANAVDHARIAFAKGAGERGIRVVDIDWRSAALGWLRRDDVITAVNGFALRKPEDASRAYTEVASRGAAVVELLRDGRPMALRVDWVR